MAQTPKGAIQGVGGGVKSPQGIDTPVVEELQQGDETYRVTLEGDRLRGGGGGGGWGGDGTPPPHYLRNQGARIQRQRREGGGRSKADAAVAPTAGNGGGRQCGDTA